MALRSDSVETFLELMRHIIAGIADLERKSPGNTNINTDKDTLLCRNCGKKGHTHKVYRADVCFYCKEKGHRQSNCPTAKKKEEAKKPAFPTSAVTAASVFSSSSANEVAVVEEAGDRLLIDAPLISISTICKKDCKSLALIDTGSPVSFVKFSAYLKFIAPYQIALKSSSRNFRNLTNNPLDILGIVTIDLSLEQLRKTNLIADLYIMKNTSFEADIILGREFLEKNKLTLVYNPIVEDESTKANLFALLPLSIQEINSSKNDLEQIIEQCLIDHDSKAKVELKKILINVDNQPVKQIDDNCAVEVRLKDASVYAYAPRFAHAERLQLRKITMIFRKEE